ncbi:MAG: hypothetical protein ACXVRH_01900 [Thermoleophilaceae bacterium]
MILRFGAVVLAILALVVAGCGSSKKSPTSTGSSASALSAEQASAATGDIPDNQVFLTFENTGSGYSIKYPEGWTRQGSGGDVSFKDKNNVVHIVVGKGSPPTPASVAAELKALRASTPTLRFQPPRPARVGGAQMVKATYSTQSAPNPVTGKRVTLIVDRYVLATGGRRAVVDLGTAKGVDNVDAYRLMIQSFRWR